MFADNIKIVEKDNKQDDDEKRDHRITTTVAERQIRNGFVSPACRRVTPVVSNAEVYGPIAYPPSPDWNPPPKRRFISTSGGDNIPYGSKDSLQITRQSEPSPVLTVKVEEEAPACPEPEPKLQVPPPPPPPPTPPAVTPKCHQVSVIQRTPAAVKSPPVCPPTEPVRSPKESPVIMVQEPEQDAPIDYHVPKKDADLDMEIVRAIKNKFTITLRGQLVSAPVDIATTAGSVGMTTAAAGRGRSSSGGQQAAGGGGGGGCGGGGGNAAHSGSNRGSSLHSYTLGVGGGGGGAAGLLGIGGGGGGMVPGGGGGMNPGGNGKHFGGPNSPVSLPPFHESLIKSGGNCYSAQYNNQYHLMMTEQLCFNNIDTGQNPGAAAGVGGPFSLGLDGPPKQYSMLQNASSLGIDIKPDECEDLSRYVKESNGFDTLMADSDTGTSNDPLQFTATLTFAGPTADNEFLDSLNEAADLFFKEVSY